MASTRRLPGAAVDWPDPRRYARRLRFARTRVVVPLSRAQNEAILVVEDDGDGLPSAEAYGAAWEPTARLHQEEDWHLTALSPPRGAPPPPRKSGS